jgi:uncharacterized membrane protein YgcG
MTKLLFVVAAIVVVFTNAVSAQERITHFDSQITVHQDGSLTVEETIAVAATGDKIKRGIYRDFPTRHYGPFATTYTVPFEVVAVRRDGKLEAWHSEAKGRGVRVYMGSESRVLSPGRYTYTLIYKTDRQIGFFEDHDELYWNVTGNFWDFTIEQATATVTLPRGAAKQKIAVQAYTGPRGDKGDSYVAEVSEGRAKVGTTAMLPSGHGLTIAVNWPKGLVAEPTQAEQWSHWVRDNRGILAGLFGLLALVLFYHMSWMLVGRDPQSGVIMERSVPPARLTPAAARYLWRMGYDSVCYTAAVVSMAVKGLLDVQESDGQYTLIRRKDADESLLSEDEEALWDKLFAIRRDYVSISQTNQRTIAESVKALKEALKRQLYGSHFAGNYGYRVLGVVLSLGVFLLAGWLSGPTEMAGFLSMTVWLSGWTVACIALVVTAVAGWRALLKGQKGGGQVFVTLFALPFLGGWFIGLWMLVSMTAWWMALILIILVAIHALYFRLLKAPTAEGGRLLDELEGFRGYLTGEAARLETQGQKEQAASLFNAYLPYALALDADKQWANQFNDALQSAQHAEEGGYVDAYWFHGSSMRGFAPTALASGLGSALSSAVTAASSHSSGSGGGGSSGGGGGGGGGGGW